MEKFSWKKFEAGKITVYVENGFAYNNDDVERLTDGRYIVDSYCGEKDVTNCLDFLTHCAKRGYTVQDDLNPGCKPTKVTECTNFFSFCYGELELLSYPEDYRNSSFIWVKGEVEFEDEEDETKDNIKSKVKEESKDYKTTMVKEDEVINSESIEVKTPGIKEEEAIKYEEKSDLVKAIASRINSLYVNAVETEINNLIVKKKEKINSFEEATSLVGILNSVDASLEIVELKKLLDSIKNSFNSFNN